MVDFEVTKQENLNLPKQLDLVASFSKLKHIATNTTHSEAIDIAWKAVKEIIALKLMGNRGVAVPYLNEATKYGLFNILVKQRSKLKDRIVRKPSAIHWSAPLEHVLPDTNKIEDFRAANKIELVNNDSNDVMEFNLKNDKKGIKGWLQGTNFQSCEVDVKLLNVQHYKINLDKGETIVDLYRHFKDLDSIQRLYLITEVWVAKEVHLDVVVGSNKYQWNSESMMPIGFVFIKCDLSSQGVLKYGAEVERKKAAEYRWVIDLQYQPMDSSAETSNSLGKTTSSRLVKSGDKEKVV